MRAFWKALAVSVLSGATAAAADALQGGVTSGRALGTRAAVGAAIGAVAYLQQSPLSGGEK